LLHIFTDGASFHRTLTQIQMASTITAVPMLSGSNYPEWSTAMQAYLQLQKLWGVVTGQQPCPLRQYRDATESELAREPLVLRVDITSSDHQKEIDEWSNLDDSAIGAIMLRIPNNMRSSVKRDFSMELWKKVEEVYGTPGAAGVYGIFKEAILFTI
jgi:hypothetical protein